MAENSWSGITDGAYRGMTYRNAIELRGNERRSNSSADNSARLRPHQIYVWHRNPLDSDRHHCGVSIGVQTLPTYCPRARLRLRPHFYQKKIIISLSGKQAIIFFKTLLGIFNMTTSDSQKLFNKYPVREFKPDIWHRLRKDEKRIEASALVDAFLRDGGQISKAPTKKRKDGKPEIFQKDTRATKAHEKWNRKFYSGDDFLQKGPRFTSKSVPENSSAKRDIERKGGTSHAAFSGAVIEKNGRLEAKKASHATTEYLIDLVSADALRASAKRGDRHAQKIVELIEDGADDVTDAYRSATISDDLNLLNIDHDHNDKFKLAA
jgi:hypothetical protein